MNGERRSLTDRMKDAALLKTSLYEEVEHDRDATVQAAIVVGVVAVCAAIGGAGRGGDAALVSLLSTYVGWLLWAGVIYLVGDKVLGGTATWGELLRTTGFAQSPGVLLLLGIIPILGWVVRFVVGIWMLIATFIGVRQALDVSTGRAFAAVLLGWLVYVIVGIFVGALFVAPDLF